MNKEKVLCFLVLLCGYLESHWWLLLRYFSSVLSSLCGAVFIYHNS
jgi:hypothetical protein